MRPKGTGLKCTAEAGGQTDPSVLLRAKFDVYQLYKHQFSPSRGNWHILKGKQLGCNVQAKARAALVLHSALPFSAYIVQDQAQT